jgi:hypothetical protein
MVVLVAVREVVTAAVAVVVMAVMVALVVVVAGPCTFIRKVLFSIPDWATDNCLTPWS